jgi:FMN reductase
MTELQKALRVTGISGSLRHRSHTRKAVEVALSGAAAEGAMIEFVDLRDYQLPFCPGSARELESYADVGRLRQIIQRSHAVLLGSPEYHGSFSGVLKNALDVTELDDWRDKLISLVAVSGGNMGPVGALSGLRDVGRGLHAWVLPQQVAIPAAHDAFDQEGEPTAELRNQLINLGRLTVKALYRLDASVRSIE